MLFSVLESPPTTESLQLLDHKTNGETSNFRKILENIKIIDKVFFERRMICLAEVDLL